MDPATLALIITAGIVGLGIKRAGQRQAPEAPASPADTAPSFEQVSVLPNRLDGGGLRPAVTEHDDEDKGGEPADVKETGLSIRARMANAAGSSAAADVAGSASSGSSEASAAPRATSSSAGVSRTIPLYGTGGAYSGGTGGSRFSRFTAARVPTR